MEQSDEGVNADKDRKEGENQKVGQLRSRTGYPLGEVKLPYLQPKPDRLPLQPRLPRVSFPAYPFSPAKKRKRPPADADGLPFDQTFRPAYSA
jgi:hypothetical protein